MGQKSKFNREWYYRGELELTHIKQLLCQIQAILGLKTSGWLNPMFTTLAEVNCLGQWQVDEPYDCFECSDE